MDLNEKTKISEKDIIERLEIIQDKEGIILDELQQKAVLEAVRCGLLIITGGPGTGKTTTIKTIINETV